MHLKHDDQLIFFELNVIEELLRGIDSQFSELNKEIENCSDPDSFGLYDLADGICGMGFVACQWYLSTTYGWLKVDKLDALKFDPAHPCGLTIAQIINHAANYWKHREEWSLEKKNKNAERTKAAISKLSINCEKDYVLTCVLASISPSKTRTFTPLIPLLEEWSKNVSKHYDP